MTSTAGMTASCPLDGTFYACDFGERFLGCCRNGNPADTCTHGCPQGDLLPASFEKEYYEYTTQAACTSGDWWSCANTAPPFLGCCLSNPCSGGCPRSDLRAAIFTQNQTDNPLYSAIPGSSAAASLTALSSTSMTASPTTVNATGASHSDTTNLSPIHKSPTNVIVGGAIGGIVVIAGILLGWMLWYRRSNAQGNKGSDSPRTDEKASIKETVPRSPTTSDNPRQTTKASQKFPAAAPTPLGDSIPPTWYPQPTKHASRTKDQAPSDNCTAIDIFPDDRHQEERIPQELPPNEAPLPEIASSDGPRPCHELPAI